MKDALVSLSARLLLAVNRRPRLVVATLHRVGGGAKIRPEHVEHHLRLLQRHFRVVLPSQLASQPDGRLAMVTIDDCHADTYEHIFPIARRLAVPLVICTPTDFFLRGRWLWFDRVAWLLRHAPPGAVIRWNGAACRLGPAANRQLITDLKYIAPPARDQAIDRIAAQLGFEPPASPPAEFRPVAAAEMREMLSSGLVELCAHTVSHTIATVLSDEQLADELARSKRELEEFTGRPVSSFCYPNGHETDFDERTTAAVARAGFGLAFTSVEGCNALPQLEPLRVRRIHGHHRVAVFEKLVSELAEFQSALQRSRRGLAALAARAAASMGALRRRPVSPSLTVGVLSDGPPPNGTCDETSTRLPPASDWPQPEPR